jgi:hypothetical protein
VQIEPTWWITAVEAPIVAALFWMIHGLRKDLHERIDRSEVRKDEAVDRTREDLSEFKLEVARSYVPQALIRDVDRRLSAHMLRIEAKLDASLHTLPRGSMRGPRLPRLSITEEEEEEG